VELEGIQAFTLADLALALREWAGDSLIIVSDLSLGSWRSHQVATEFFEQLDLPPVGRPTAGNTTKDRFFPASLADAIGAWIDLETKGDRTVLGALEIASRMVGTLPDSKPNLFAVLLPRFGLAMERSDALFVRFLAEGLRNCASRLVLVCADPKLPVVPEDWHVRWHRSGSAAPPWAAGGDLHLVPGVLNEHIDLLAAVNAQEDSGLGAFGRAFLAAPECRRSPDSVSRFQFDRLASRTTVPWLRAYAMYHGNNCYVEASFLLEQGAERIAEGGEDLGLRLLQRAQSCATSPIQRAFLQAQLQGLRIAMQRYAEAAAAADPAPHLPEALRGILFETKGWAVLMAQDPQRAVACLRQALQLLEPALSDTREWLYLQNIYALALLRSGDARGALDKERAIERARRQLAIADPRLAYVNLINLARLYRLEGQWDRSADYYGHAFETTLGVRSESDCVYTNACIARLEEARGRRTEAFYAWLRAALHWVSSSAPEALGRRVVAMLLEHRPCIADRFVVPVSEVLFDHLVAAAGSAGLEVPPLNCKSSSERAATSFARMPQLAGPDETPVVAAAVGASGWGAFLGERRVPPCILGRPFQRLCTLLVRLLDGLCPKGGIDQAKTMYVDDQLGREMPTTFAESVGACLRHQVRRLCYADTQVLIEQSAMRTLELAIEVQISPCVAGHARIGEQKVVTFRRGLPSQTLSVTETQILELVDGGIGLGQLCERLRRDLTPDTIVRSARNLERDRVLYLKPPGPIDLRRSGMIEIE
jgi:tetratricopeptide (TPR) repeat protein